MSKIYSPSSTANFLECEVKWVLSQQGWRSRQYGKKDVYALRGSAIGVGCDVFHNGKGSAAAYMAVKNYIAEEWERSKLNSREWAEFKSIPLTQPEVVDMACSVVETYTEAQLPYIVLKSEYEFSKHGRARADIIGQVGSGPIIPIDLKTKDKPAQVYYEYLTKRDFAFSHQMCHYMYALSEETGTLCLSYGIVLLWYGKKNSIEYVPYSISEKRFDLWLTSARSTWERMEAVEAGHVVPAEHPTHKSQWGMCEYYDACLNMNRSPILMQDSFFKVIR